MTTTTKTAAPLTTLPSGIPVHVQGGGYGPGTGQERHARYVAAHEPEIVDERIAWHREHFAVGVVVMRDDGCTVRIDRMEAPTVGGYVYASGTETTRGGLNFAVFLAKATPVHWVARPAGSRLP